MQIPDRRSDNTKVPHTLLLADDSVTIQRVIELTFADEDIKVVAVGDGDQAIERLKASPPDIVLADIGMPGKSGYEVAQFVRQRSDLAHIPVVLLTGAFEPVDEARAAEAGCDGVLAKPFEPQMVIGRVKDLLAKGRAGTAPAVDEPAGSAAQPSAPASPATPASAAAAASPVDTPLDEYFDRLDAAFSNLSAPPGASAQPPAPEVPTHADAPPAQPPDPADMQQWTSSPAVDPGDIDWFNAAPAPREPAADLPQGAAEPAADLTLPNASIDAEFASAWEASAGAPEKAAPAPMEPVLADAMSWPKEDAHSEDQSAPAESAIASAAPSAPSAPRSLPTLGDAFAVLLDAETHDQSSAAPAWPGTAPSSPPVSEALIDDIVRRVLERMSNAVVRETTADLVSRIAEQLVREEIEKIKAAVK